MTHLVLLVLFITVFSCEKEEIDANYVSVLCSGFNIDLFLNFNNNFSA